MLPFPIISKIGFAVLAASALQAARAQDAESNKGYYTQPSLFFPRPEPLGPTWKVPNFGPVGVGIHLEKPNFTMRITRVEEGSPADKTGKLKPGQIIESVNGQVLKDRDPREILADWITEAEATDGKMLLKIKGEGEVLVQIPVLGRYSPTWPENCPKSDKIVRNLADRIAKQEKPEWGAIIFLLSTGEDKDLEVVRKWVKDIKTTGPYPWHKGYNGPGLCEYYLRTGDKSILPVIERDAADLKTFWYNNAGWSGRGKAAFDYGQLNAAGVHCLNFLLMAKLCGVAVDGNMLNQSLRHFYRYAGHGTLAYGDHMPNSGFRDNGKVGGLAVAMGSAALLTPGGGKSIYAQARDSSSMKSFYATNWFHSAHTGGGLGEIWHNVTMCMVKEKRPDPYRSYLDTRRWIMDLSRRHDGGIGIAGLDDRYDVATGENEIAWGNFFALTYTIHRKKLQMFGAPRSPYAVSHPLPERPWGNAADDIFQDPDPAAHPSITLGDLLKEKVETDSSAPAMAAWKNIETDAGFLKYIHHPEYGLRTAMALTVSGKNRADLVLTMLKSPDPRVRECGLVALIGEKKGDPLPDGSLTPEMLGLVEGMFTDTDESWWLKIRSIYAMTRWGADPAVRHKAALLKCLEHEDWWFQRAALEALRPIATDPQHAKDVLPAMAGLFGRTRISQILIFARNFQGALEEADKEVLAAAMPHFKEAFDQVPREFVDPASNYVMPGGGRYARNILSGLLADLPGGLEVARLVPKTTLRSAISGKDEDMYAFSGTFEPVAKLVGKWKEVGELTDSATIAEAVKIRADSIAKTRKQMEDREARRAAAGVKPKLDKKGRPKKSGGLLDRMLAGTFLELRDGGQVAGSPMLFWTGDMLLDSKLGEARRMMLHDVGGKTYLLVEKGGFIPLASEKEDADNGGGDSGEGSETRPASWHCGYLVYERAG